MFRSTRGVRQDDPLSSLLFVLAQQILTASLKLRTSKSLITGLKVGRGELTISHLLYADDVLILTNGSENSSVNLMNLFSSYGKSSGQLISQT